MAIDSYDFILQTRDIQFFEARIFAERFDGLVVSGFAFPRNGSDILGRLFLASQ
jgi:hypothetical protein